MNSKKNFWKFAATLAIITAVAMVTAAILITKHQRQERFERAARITEGNPHTGAALIEKHGCGGCHTIPGIRSATAHVGPDLSNFRSRHYVGGVLENSPENVRRWVMNPPAVDPKTAMPNLGISDGEAVDIVAYLYTLE